MSIYVVRDNLRKTIAGKEKYLADVTAEYLAQTLDVAERMAVHTTIEFLKININELKLILNDVEHCCIEASRIGWELNPERMGQ